MWQNMLSVFKCRLKALLFRKSYIYITSTHNRTDCHQRIWSYDIMELYKYVYYYYYYYYHHHHHYYYNRQTDDRQQCWPKLNDIRMLWLICHASILQQTTDFMVSYEVVTGNQWRRNEFENRGTGPQQKWRAAIRRFCAGKFFFGSVPQLFGSKSTIKCSGECFYDCQYSLVSFLFAVLLLGVPPCPAICKSVGARAPWSRRHCW